MAAPKLSASNLYIMEHMYKAIKPEEPFDDLLWLFYNKDAVDSYIKTNPFTHKPRSARAVKEYRKAIDKYTDYIDERDAAELRSPVKPKSVKPKQGNVSSPVARKPAVPKPKPAPKPKQPRGYRYRNTMHYTEAHKDARLAYQYCYKLNNRNANKPAGSKLDGPSQTAIDRYGITEPDEHGMYHSTVYENYRAHPQPIKPRG